MAKILPHRAPRASGPPATPVRASVVRSSSSPPCAPKPDQHARRLPNGLHQLQDEIEACARCGSLKPWRKFQQNVYGDPNTGYLLVGEAPGRVSWQKARRFTGPAGVLIRRALRSVGHPRYRHLEDLFYMTDAVKCHPSPDTGSALLRPGANRTPRANEVRTCAPFLHRELQILRPTVVVTFGKQAAASVDQAIALCRSPSAGWNPERLAFPHPSPRNRRTILKAYPSIRAFEDAITDAFRALVSRLGHRTGSLRP